MSFVSRRRVLLFSLLLATGFLSSHASNPQQRAPDPNVVTVVFSPLDKNGNMITTLTKSDVRLYDEGTEQTILSFERIRGQPISIYLLVDTSISQGRLQETAKLTARTFVEGLIQSGVDQVAVIGFSGKARVEQELTTDKQTVVQAIERLHFATPASVAIGSIISGRTLPDRDAVLNGATAIWDTIWNASEGLSLSSTAGTRRAILLLSDGEDNFSSRTMKQAIERALRYDVAVYAIGMGDKNYNGVRQSSLKKIADETGGRVFFPRKTPELQGIFSQLGEELRSPYLLKYARTNRKPSGEVQKLRIQLVNPGLRDMRVDYRRGYVSP